MATGNGGKFDHHRGIAPLLRPTGPWRTGLFLVINLAGFAVVNAFWQYLARGQWLDFSAEAYLRDLSTPLGEMFVYPLSLLHHPWMVVVASLLLALVIFVPIIVAVLYRLVFALAFVIVVGAIGHAPVLGVTLLISCILAARTPLRSDMPFLALLLGLLPVAAYLYLFGLAGAGSAAVQPLQRWVLVAPSVLAMVLAVISGIVVLSLARATRYRPGAVWPVLVVLLACPLAIFYQKIGTDELDFALIAGHLADGDAIFQPQPLEPWRAQHNAQGLTGETLLSRVRDDLHARQRQLTRRCDEFLATHPRSDRAAAVLWIRGQCRMLQVSRDDLDSGKIRYVAWGPLSAATTSWQELTQDHAGAPQAALAQWWLASLALRDGDVAEADERLAKAAKRLRRLLSEDIVELSDEAKSTTVFRPPPVMPSRAYYGEVLFEAERLLWMIERNNVLDDARCAEAMAAYLAVDPQGLSASHYYDRLAQLAGKYEDTALGENLKLAVAMATTDPYERAEQLVLLADQRGDIDAAIEANFHLGALAIRKHCLGLPQNVQRPEDYLERVTKAPPNPYQAAAGQQLNWLSSVAEQGD